MYEKHIMDKTYIQDILPLVEKPSRYLGSEINSIKKKLQTVDLKIVLAFPDLYEIGTSHFGLQILYHRLNKHSYIAAERVFAPAPDMQAKLKEYGLPLMSLETHTPLKAFDMIGFSLLYELNYTNILGILDSAQIPFYASERNTSHPVIIAGGPCVCNPEPVAEFFDAMVFGDGEDVIGEMCTQWRTWKQEDENDRTALLNRWVKIEGVYIPSFFKPQYDADGFQTLLPLRKAYKRVSRRIVSDLNAEGVPAAPIVPFGKPIHDRLRLEIARGCTRGCRFCQAGMIYRPVRERSVRRLMALAESALCQTGYQDMSLLSLSTGDYGAIGDLMEQLMHRYKDQKISVSLPSLRAGTLTPQLMELVKQVRKTGFTIAPEAGSQRLRDVINKNITEEEIFATVKNAFALGWGVIKLYFMIGLPTEKKADLDAIVELVKKLHQVKGSSKRRGKLNVSISTFIPKPHTPFQWAQQDTLEESRQKIQYLKKELRLPGVQVKWQRPEVSLLEGLWARGDRRLNRLLVAAYQNGCRFDGWSERFKYELWKQAFLATDIDPAVFTTRSRSFTEPLPWDHMDAKIKKDFLIKENQKANKGEFTEDCRFGGCSVCGTCDFKDIKPRVFEYEKIAGENGSVATHQKTPVEGRLQVNFAKQGDAKYFGHLELANLFLRAIKRAEIPVKYSNGFHPKPKISFADPLPVGIESLGETFYIQIMAAVDANEMKKALNRYLPEGLRVLDCRYTDRNKGGSKGHVSVFQVRVKGQTWDQEKLDAFYQKDTWILAQTNFKGKTKKIDLKETVMDVTLLDPFTLSLKLRTLPGKNIRPIEATAAIFNISPELLKGAHVVRTRFRIFSIEM